MGAKAKCKHKRVLTLLGLIGATAAMVVGSGCAYNLIASRALAREIAETERDPRTGIVVGCEPRDLGRGRRLGVLLIHGYVGSPRDFGRLPDALASAGYRVSIPLLPGHGTRPNDFEKVTAGQLFESVTQSYSRLRRECEKVAALGFSMGGALALQLVRERTLDGPDALVLASPHLGVTYRWYVVLTPETWAKLAAPFIPYTIKGRTFVMVNRKEAMADLYAYRVVPTASLLMLNQLAADVYADPPTRVPKGTLIVYASGDGAASPRCARKMADRLALPQSSRLVLTKSNHHVFHDYEREKAIGRIVDFIREHLGPGSIEGKRARLAE